MTTEMIHQSNGYLPIVIDQGDKGGLVEIRQKNMLGIKLHPFNAELLGRLFEHMVRKFRDKPEEDTFTLNLHYTDDNGNPLIAVLVLKGHVNGNAGDWFLAPQDHDWKDRLLEGSRHLEEMAEALETFEGGFRKKKG